MNSQIVDDHKEEKKEILNKQFGIIHNGEDNLSPLIIENLISKSTTAKRGCNMYASFLSGGGFNQEFKGVDVDPLHNKKISPDKLLFNACNYISKHEGVFIHVEYQGDFKKKAFRVLPYNLCRVGKKDDANFSGKIVVSPQGWGRRVKKDSVKVYDTYNSNPKVINSQVIKSGGWSKYLGQIYYFKFDDDSVYSESLIETVAAYCDTEYKMGLFFNSTVDNGFTDTSVVYHKEAGEAEINNLKANLKAVKGVKQSGKSLLIESNWENDPKKDGQIFIDTLPSDQKPDRYQYFDETSEDKIISVLEIPSQLIKVTSGKLGNTSGEDLKIWQSIYNTRIARKKQLIEEFFEELFDNYKEDINPTNDWSIKQYKLLDDGTTEEVKKGEAV